MRKYYLFFVLTALRSVVPEAAVPLGPLGRAVSNIRTFSFPSAGIYDALAEFMFGGLHRRIVGEVVARHQSGVVLDVGSGPGHLAVLLARTAPALRVVGLDISPEMVDLAENRAERSGASDRVRFQAGSACALPFPDGHFDMVVSTMSLHHWPDPAQGLDEVYRVLKPGSEAWIYDVPDWISRTEHPGLRLAKLAGPMVHGLTTLEVVRWPGGLPGIRRLRLRKTSKSRSDRRASQ